MNMKFRVFNVVHSKQIQEALFKLGYKWSGDSDGVVQQTQARYLYSYEGNRYITYSCVDEEDFIDHRNVECELFCGIIQPLAIPTFTETEKPAIGLRPKSVVDNLRVHEILEAMQRYADDARRIPVEWITELSELNKEEK